MARTLQPGQVVMQDDPIQAAVAELDALPKQLRQSVHGTPSLGDALLVATPGIIALWGSPVDSLWGFPVHLARSVGHGCAYPQPVVGLTGLKPQPVVCRPTRDPAS